VEVSFETGSGADPASFPETRSDFCLLHAGIFLGLIFVAEDRDVPPKRRLTFNGLYGVISQKIEHFMLAS
jgi:hypothetical protein